MTYWGCNHVLAAQKEGEMWLFRPNMNQKSTLKSWLMLVLIGSDSLQSVCYLNLNLKPKVKHLRCVLVVHL